MKTTFFLAIASLFFLAAPLHSMTTEKSYDGWDTRPVTDPTDALLERLQKMLADCSEEELLLGEILPKLSNELIKHLPDDHLEALILLLTEHIDFTSKNTLEVPYIPCHIDRNNNIFSLLKTLSLTNISVVLSALRQCVHFPIDTDQEFLITPAQEPAALRSPLDSAQEPTRPSAGYQSSTPPFPSSGTPPDFSLQQPYHTPSKFYQCDQCDHKPFTSPSGLAKHKKTKHEGLTFQCDRCDHKPFAFPAGLAQHKKTNHEGLTYQCDLCDHKPFTDPSHLAQHKKTTHEGITYQCNLCNHKPFTDPSGLAQHKKTTHEGLTYQCNLCSHKPFMTQQNLAQHKKTKHEGIFYQCDRCDHEPYASYSGLAYHKKTKHGD